jgi:hypothetical protein
MSLISIRWAIHTILPLCLKGLFFELVDCQLYATFDLIMCVLDAVP